MADRDEEVSAFTAAFAAALADTVEGLKVLEVADDHFRAHTAEGVAFTTYVDNAFKLWRGGTAFDEVVARFAASLGRDELAGMAARPENIVACVRGVNLLEDDLLYGFDAVFEPLAGDIGVAYCVDSPSSIRYLKRGERPDDPADMDRLSERARENIARVIKPIRETRGDGLSLFTAGGDYEASLILHDEAIAVIEKVYGRRFAFAIANRDIFLVGDTSRPEVVTRLKALAKKGFETGANPISRTLFLFDDGAISVFE